MKSADSWYRSRNLLLVCLCVLFLFLLLLNCLTPYIADDYGYRLGFHNKEPLESLGDVARSMYVHCFAMNGRVVSHSLEQIFMLMPKLVFNICNAAVFTGLIYLMYRVVNLGRKRNVLLLVAVGMAFWYFMPVFGQVALWQVGALNYLWALLVGLGLMLPYIYCFYKRRELLKRIWQKAIFCVLAFFAGMYSEVTSFVAILLALILLVLAMVLHREKGKTWLWIPLGLAVAGFFVMMLMPAEMSAKQGELTLEALMGNFSAVTELLRQHLLVLCLTWAAMFALGCWLQADRDRLILSGLFVFGALTASYMLIVASYIPERCLCTTTMLLILACGVLVPELLRKKSGALCACGGAVLTVAFLFQLVTGSYEIWRNYSNFMSREQLIAEYVAAGETDLVLPLVHANSEYSAFWGTKDLDTETTDTWPNTQMAEYYGVNSIIGY